jgi:hypothetical protein
MLRTAGLFLSLLWIVEGSCIAAPADPASDASIEEWR